MVFSVKYYLILNFIYSKHMFVHLPPKVMIIDSDVVTRTSASNILERNGFNVVTFASGNDALKKLDRFSGRGDLSLIIIDNALSDFSGIEVCTILRTKKIATQIILIAREEDKIDSLKGADNAFDDYMIRPINQKDLVRKVKLILGNTKPVLQSKVISFYDITLNLASYKVERAGRSVHLGPIEFQLLQSFVKNPTKIFSRKELIESIWSDRENVEARTIDVHINRLRLALKLPYEHIPVIKTVRSAGYCLNVPEKVYANA